MHITAVYDGDLLIDIRHYNAARLFALRDEVPQSAIDEKAAHDLERAKLIQEGVISGVPTYRLTLDSDKKMRQIVNLFKRHVRYRKCVIVHHRKGSDAPGTIMPLLEDGDDVKRDWVRVLDPDSGEYRMVIVQQRRLF